MSEQLTQNEIITNGEFGNYVSLSIGSSTINQLKKAKKLPSKDYGGYGNLKPDGLLIDERNKKDISVICVIEFKKPSEFNTKEKKEIATKQCNTYCQLVNAKFGVISDGQTYIWINPKSKKPEIQYFDNDVFQNKSKVERGYSYILREDGYELGAHYILNKSQETETKETLKLIEKILSHINESNSQFIQEEYKNPSNLARSVWQDVWISKSASPEKSLSTFIEVFMFKFLSDLEVLTEDQNGNKVSFTEVISKGQDKCLKYYFSNVREYIKELFPSNQNDQTTLINGISLSPSVVEDNQVFYRILKKFDEFGDLKNIDPEFQSRLFEDFLKKSISKKNWGQFFTPRNVVKAIVEMSEIDKLPDGSNVYDPACGVGGFLLEPLITKRPTDY
ncbi:MAG: N-6 DNA methylase, partial [Bacteroidetes bacterium]|nr:N-6 DNA methylase [Bacteroidota bacterium]